jgi:hypothetical protein
MDMMKFIEHDLGSSKAVEVLSDKIIINTEQDAQELMATIGYQYNCRKIILYKNNLCEDFFELSSGIAGAVMQKFSNYRVQVAIFGDINGNSKSLKAFIVECNRTRQVQFVKDLTTALQKLS